MTCFPFGDLRHNKKTQVSNPLTFGIRGEVPALFGIRGEVLIAEFIRTFYLQRLQCGTEYLKTSYLVGSIMYIVKFPRGLRIKGNPNATFRRLLDTEEWGLLFQLVLLTAK